MSAAYRVHRCAACEGALQAPCTCARCGVELHAGCRRARSRGLQKSLHCPKCGALMARDGADQALVLGVLLVVTAYLVFGGALSRDRNGGAGGGYGTPHVARAHHGSR